MNYILHIVTLAALFGMLASSLNLVTGFGGFVSIAQAAFFGVGAYTSAVLSLEHQMPFLVTGPLAVATGAVLGLLIALPSFRVRDDTFVIVTFAVQVVLLGIFNNWHSVTGGVVGLAGIPQLRLGPWVLSGRPAYAMAAVTLLLATQFLVWRIARSPFGRVLLSIRDDETLSLTSGKKVAVIKSLTFAISSATASLAGAVFAHYMTFIDSSSFAVMDSVFVLSMVIVGGAGSLWGPVLGAVLLVSIPEVLRFLGLPTSIAANIRQMLYGSALVACMLWRPQGLIGEYAFGREAKPK